MKYTFDSLNVYFRYYKSALQLNLDSTIFDFDFDFWQNTVAKQAPFDNTLLHGREKVKIGAVFVKCVVFKTVISFCETWPVFFSDGWGHNFFDFFYVRTSRT